MPEPDDELDALRHADPVDRAAVPSGDSGPARALFERIVRDPAATSAPRRHAAPRWVPAVAAAVAIVVAISALALGGDEDTGGKADQAATSSTATTGDGPITPGGVASCVEPYSLAALAHREVAFDGTVESVDGDAITFVVHRWFRGGDGGTTTRRGASTLGAPSSAGAEIGLDPGTRLLVAGDGDFAWGCGFTQPYDEAVAAAWADVLGA